MDGNHFAVGLASRNSAYYREISLSIDHPREREKHRFACLNSMNVQEINKVGEEMRA